MQKPAVQGLAHWDTVPLGPALAQRWRSAAGRGRDMLPSTPLPRPEGPAPLAALQPLAALSLRFHPHPHPRPLASMTRMGPWTHCSLSSLMTRQPEGARPPQACALLPPAVAVPARA